MFPVIFALGPIVITTLGVFAVLSFFFGSFFLWRKAKQEHIEDGDIFDLIFISLFTGLIGGRLGYIASHIADFGVSIGKWIDPVGSYGFSWFGFLIGFMLGTAFICHKKKWDFFEVADFSVVGILVGQILLRIGQFFDSSFVGSVTNLPWGIPFPGFDGIRHPLSLYEIPFLFIFIWLVHYLDKHYRLYAWYRNGRGEAKPGFLWLSYLFCLTILNIFLDFAFIRHYMLLVVSLRQIGLMGMLILTIFWFYKRAGNDFGKKKNIEKLVESEKKLITNDQIKEDIKLENQPVQTLNNNASNIVLSEDAKPITGFTGRRFFRTRK